MNLLDRQARDETRERLEFMIGLAVGFVTRQRMRLRAAPGDRGDVLQTVVIIGLFVVGAIAIVGIIVGKARSQAESISVP